MLSFDAPLRHVKWIQWSLEEGNWQSVFIIGVPLISQCWDGKYSNEGEKTPTEGRFPADTLAWSYVNNISIRNISTVIKLALYVF